MNAIWSRMWRAVHRAIRAHDPSANEVDQERNEGTAGDVRMKACASRMAAFAAAALVAACSKSDSDPRTVENAAAGAVSGGRVADVAALPLDRQLANLGSLTDIVAAESADLPRAEFDPGALVAAIGKDRTKIFEWVRDRTYWAPYRGLLRGSRGVMLDRVGSSLDRAVLLGELMRQAGHTVRLSHAEIPEARARDLFDKVRPIPEERRTPVARKPMPPERRRAMVALVPDFEKQLEQQLAESRRIIGEAEALVRSQTESLLDVTREKRSAEASSDKDAAIAAIRDHWWVEIAEDGAWTAMDVLLPGAKPGETLVAATRVSEWKKESASPSIPDSDWHAVQIRVVVERYEAGATSESTVLETLLRPAETLERSITLSHVPVPWPAEIPDPAVDAQPFRDAALAARLWIPILRVGDNRIIQSGFTNEGKVEADLSAPVDEIRQTGVARVASGMDMALGGFGGDEAVPAATAEWLDYEIRVPGARPERLRRSVFDLLGPARRANKASDFDGTADLRILERFEALWAPTDILLQPCDFSGEFVANLDSARFLAVRQALADLARERDAASAKVRAVELFGDMDFWSPLPTLALLRSGLAGSPRNSFIDRPNVLTYRGGRKVSGTDQADYRELIDIAANGGGVRATASSSAFDIRVRQGVADTVAEILALSSDMQHADNTASVFARLAREGSRGMLVAAHDRAAAMVLPWPEDEAMRVGADVDAGFMAVVPRKAVTIDGVERVGWWRVHPSTGETIGVMDTGYHQMDYAKLVGLVSTAGAFLSNPNFVNRAQRLQQLANNSVRLNAAQRHFLDVYWACRRLDTAIAALGG